MPSWAQLAMDALDGVDNQLQPVLDETQRPSPEASEKRRMELERMRAIVSRVYPDRLGEFDRSLPLYVGSKRWFETRLKLWRDSIRNKGTPAKLDVLGGNRMVSY